MNYENLFTSELPIYVSEKTGLKFYYRPNTSDIKTIMEVVERNVYEKKYFKIEKGEHWIDFGGNVGAFTLLALYKGATVDVYEADDEHCELIKMNLELNGLKANVYNKAIVSDDTKEITLFVQKNGNTWRNSIVKNWGGGKKIVECINFNDVLKIGSNCKIDIEGAEMLLIETLNIKLNKLVFEWSFDIDDDINRYRKAVEKMKNLFTKVHAGSIDENHSKWLKSWFPPCKNVFCYNDQQLTNSIGCINERIMNITVTKVLRELKNKHGWENMNIDGDNKWFIEHLIKDTIDVINDELIKYKNISIKKK